MTKDRIIPDKSRRAPKRDIDGVFLLDKPTGISSALALTKVRGIFRANKAGHTGSLDPLASGLLPVCLGQAAKFSSYFLEGSKKYIATGRLGIVTDSGDAEGNVVEEHEIGDALSKLDEAINRFVGDITQVPPIYSAIKVDGRPLYKYARAGKSVEVPSREVTVFYIKLLDKTEDSFTIEVYCSKGTYIRTLVSDIGAELGCGAHVTMLRRIEVDGLPKGEMHTLEKLQQLADKREDFTDFKEMDSLLITIDEAMNYLPRIDIPYDMAVLLCQGQRQDNLSECTFTDCDLEYKDTIQIRTNDMFIGVGHIQNGTLISDRMMSDPLHTNKGLYK
ncbi:tRNA pseudouridine(55) synthase TruB [Succinivibrio dextrinosolvens]|uniref:tRNA pseudouridine synthase B n=1 Tax=Succinivibrio dextrinosolvens TaxID=83771 RepID=A0A662ZD30_9GAMM|nr:tRNA pseudouridine(55) synthase TruB [Succinivibrio dextrinosolvens]SFK10743.1 tRNA pseudouridine synthase B [Succinivibrio dextrinosolvens]